MKKILFFSLFLLANYAFAQEAVSLKTQYNAPGTTWESDALPLGNGKTGAMLYGDVAVDILQINEHTLWSGGPGKNPAYNGGHLSNATALHNSLQKLRTALQDKMTAFTAANAAYIDGTGKVVAQNYPAETATETALINALVGGKNDFGSYQSLGNLNIAYPEMVPPAILSITGDCDNPGAGEKFTQLFDGNLSSKWYADQGFKGFPCYIAWNYDRALTVTAYTLTSGNDVPDRDPKSWNMYGSTDGVTYSLIDARTAITFTGRNQSVTFNLSVPVTYAFFKFEITETAGGNTPPQLSEIALDYGAGASFSYSNYLRELDIDRAVSKLTYTKDGVDFTREYFISHPDKVLVVKYSASAPASLSRTVYLTTPQTKSVITAAADGSITFTGQPSDQTANGLKFAQYLKVIPTGGTVSVSGDKILIQNADAFVIITSTSSNYVQCQDNSFNYFSSTDPLTTVQASVNAAAAKTYETLLSAHVADYQSLYKRMSLNLNGAANASGKLTPDLLSGYKNGTNSTAENLYLEQLYYQFGRYLLISCSRPNGLPANLQGIWADGLTPPWNADYHTNINLQMNYWLAEPTNLADCHLPVIEYVKSLVPRGRNTAKQYYCKQDGGDVRGWVIHHENTIWGNTAPGNYYWGFYFPAAAAWMCQDIWEYYQFNQDKTFLENNYPILLEAAQFWVDNLWRDSRDGTLVANPSYSPEHGPYSLGASCDQAIITEIFDIVLKAYKALHPAETNLPAEIKEIEAAKSRTAGPQIGLNGQFMEWKDELTIDISGDGQHRHANHLFWLHPGSQIITGRSAQDNLYAEAMKKTLNTRGDGGTGWSKAWKINFWARLHDGNHSHKLLEELLKESTLINLFDTHPPFQIDGNFGATAGMTEMLVQSHGDYIELFAALPDAWSSGKYSGIKARGNFELNCQWTNKTVDKLEVKSLSGNVCKLKYPGIANYNTGGVAVTVIDQNTIEFNTAANTVYTFTR